MADPKMRWDKSQNRWRGMYKNKRFTVRAKDLGGTGRDDTVVAANRWFERKKNEYDTSLRHAVLRPYEEEYKSELESIQTTLRELAEMMKNPDMRTTVEPVYKITKEKEAKLKNQYRQESLPALDDSLRNPLHLSAKQVEADAEREAIDTLVRASLYQYRMNKKRTGWLESQGYASLRR